MRVIRLSQPRSDCLIVNEGRDWRRATVGVVLLAAWLTVALLVSSESGASVLYSLLSVVVLPVAVVAVQRLLRKRTLSVIRMPGRLLLNGEPIELARVELRVTHVPVLKTPTGYALSLWVMTATGPDDVPLGHFESMFEASKVGGHLEEFIGRVSSRQPGRTAL